jgi:type VI secretion system protein ImpG
LNRDLPSRLPFGGGQPHLQLAAGGAPIDKVECLTPPTPTHRPQLGHRAFWRLVSHLSLNHLSLSGADAAPALREILTLYDFRDSAETRAMIEGVLSVSSRPATARAPGGLGGVCRGNEVAIEFDAERFAGAGVFLFASVLERFLALYCTVNSFSTTVASLKGREGALRRWPPRAGMKTLQ